jgi:hypothetical protein
VVQAAAQLAQRVVGKVFLFAVGISDPLFLLSQNTPNTRNCLIQLIFLRQGC